MKKLFVLLLALAVVTGAFAQVTTSISLQGQVKVLNEDSQGQFVPKGDTYDTFTFKASTDTYGFSMTDTNWLTGLTAPDGFQGFGDIRDWNVWYKLADGKVKVTFGNLRDATFRTTLTGWLADFGAMDRIAGYGLFTTWMPMDGLTVGLNLPFGLTAEDTADVLQKADIGLQYKIADVGTLNVLVDLNMVGDDNVFELGFAYTGVENLTATAIYKGELDAEIHSFVVEGDYVMDALEAGASFMGIADASTDFAWEVNAYGYYDITEKIYSGLEIYYWSDETYDFWGNLGYNFGNGLKADLSLGYNADFYYAVALKYAVTF
ncbi:MAG TPA: hypothetical protein P5117_05145 [Spirochaetia bacterium]|nr:hypothetical protein [Spirochaetia bacterium]HRZ88854.1 hypothetical protein [Spirochaetia bacterium]